MPTQYKSGRYYIDLSLFSTLLSKEMTINSQKSSHLKNKC